MSGQNIERNFKGGRNATAAAEEQAESVLSPFLIMFYSAQV
jgi:hypothetical protein